MHGSILITGGTGSFGRAFAELVLREHPRVERLVVFSRDELKQSEMAQRLSSSDHPRLRFVIGDVRDKDRLWRAMEGMDTVVHAAALKHIPVAESNCFEAIKTNVLGAQHVIEAALDRNVTRVVALSTDKAVAPISLYGATKLCADKLFVSANQMGGERSTRFSLVRYGNVIGSRGSVVPLFLQRRRHGRMPVTDVRMTRFSITLEQGVRFVLFALDQMQGGETYVPKIPSYRILDVVEAVAPGCEIETIGIRPGEKVHEVLITENEAADALEFDDHFVVLPAGSLATSGAGSFRGGRACAEGFAYRSDCNDRWLTVDDLRAFIHEHAPDGLWIA